MAPDLEDTLGRVFGVHRTRITVDTSNENLPEWDSLAHVTLIAELESTYGLSISTEDALRLTSVEAIRSFLKDRGGA